MNRPSLKARELFSAWGKILHGERPILSIEITRECPLRCPGCYAYEPAHLGSAGPLRQLSDFQGEALIAGVLGLVRRYRPFHVSIVGGEPLVRYRELCVLLPKLVEMGLHVQVVTSAVRPIPQEWNLLPNLQIAVSIDGLQPEHDARRAPATYERILKHITGHRIVVHCTITRPQLSHEGYLREFAAFWSAQKEVRKIWFSLYTPQEGDRSAERLTLEDRWRAVRELATLPSMFEEVEIPEGALDAFLHPPQSPDECIFAQTTTCVSADLTTRIEPCQFGGKPVCSECGCLASAGFAAMGRRKVAGLIPASALFTLSTKVGKGLQAEFPPQPEGTSGIGPKNRG